MRQAAAAFAVRDDDLHRLDLCRVLEPDWFQKPSMVGYAAYADRFAGDLAGVAKRIDYLTDLGVGYLHLMPLLTPRSAPNDGGYAVADYYGPSRPGHRRGPALPDPHPARARRQPLHRPGAQPRRARAHLGAAGARRRPGDA